MNEPGQPSRPLNQGRGPHHHAEVTEFWCGATPALQWSTIPDDWGGRPDGRAPRGSCLAISAHLSDRGAGTAPPLLLPF